MSDQSDLVTDPNADIQEHILQLNALLQAVQQAWQPLGIVSVENGTDMAIHLAVLAGLCLGLDNNEQAAEQHLTLIKQGAELAKALEALNQNKPDASTEDDDFNLIIRL